MKKILALCIGLTILFSSCSSDSDETASNKTININFKIFWGNAELSKDDFNDFKFTTEHGEVISIERLRYVLSDILITDQFGNTKKMSDYNLVDIGEETGFSLSGEGILFNGNYTLSFVFGFTDEKNTSGTYQDLNTVNFNVPDMMGGGYHYMQFDGKYKNTNDQEKPFNYHAIRAFKRENGVITELKDTSLKVSLSGITVQGNEATINVKMDASKWFANDWDLNTWDTPLMPNYDAQIQMNTNAKEVFSLLE